MTIHRPFAPPLMEVFPDQMQLHRVDPGKNMRRFYVMTVQPDLFGGATLIRLWGRLGSPGRVRIDRHSDEGHAVNALAVIVAAKRKRGYQ